ncbi:AraC family transcriptional regulator [Wukongibacter baidiensis]|uniref:helix-turn-helix domain-containing protein n=1 Tax=Wukongibacter baidiensis TaxID=1723361 RepID=UPI003D7FABEE
MKYVNIIEDTVKYIEDNLETDIDLEMLANRFYLSKFYFHRIFTAVIGASPKDYIIKRRLNYALELLNSTEIPMIEIAQSVGFGSQQSFTRAFKRNYGVTPGTIRKGEISTEPMGVPGIVERAFKNFKSDIVTDFSFVEKPEIKIAGFFTKIDLNDEDIKNRLEENASIIKESPEIKEIFSNRELYSITFSNKDNSRLVNIFFGILDDFRLSENENISTVVVPPMLYAKFRYKGDILSIRDTVIKDVHRWMKISKIEVEPMEISFMRICDKDFSKNGRFELYLPIHKLPQAE